MFSNNMFSNNMFSKNMFLKNILFKNLSFINLFAVRKKQCLNTWVVSLLLLILPCWANSSGQNLEICDGEFAEIPTPDTPSGGCVVETHQVFTDQAIIDAYSMDVATRRYIVYAPQKLPKRKPVPVVFVYHGHSVNAESVALYDTRNQFDYINTLMPIVMLRLA